VHLEHGFVAVKNRNSRSKTKKEDLSGCWSTESAWFAKESAFRQCEKDNKAVAVELSDRLGLCALLKKIDTVFCKHLNEHWVPKEVAAVDKELAALKVRYGEVSICLRRLGGSDLTNFVEHIRSRIANVLSDSQLERWCQEYVLAQLQKASGQWDKNSLVACLRGVHKAKADLARCFADAPTHFSSVFETALVSEFNKASPSPGDLGDPACWAQAMSASQGKAYYWHKETRKMTWENPELSFFKFIDLRPYEHVLRDVLQALRKFLVKQSAMVGYEARLEMACELLLHNRGDFLQENASRPSLEASVRLILLRHLLLPCVQGIGEKDPNTPFEFLPLPMPWLPCPAGFAAGASVFKEEKKLLEEKMQTCNEVKKSLRALC